VKTPVTPNDYSKPNIKVPNVQTYSEGEDDDDISLEDLSNDEAPIFDHHKKKAYK
jgi:hypothetical protein